MERKKTSYSLCTVRTNGPGSRMLQDALGKKYEESPSSGCLLHVVSPCTGTLFCLLLTSFSGYIDGRQGVWVAQQGHQNNNNEHTLKTSPSTAGSCAHQFNPSKYPPSQKTHCAQCMGHVSSMHFWYSSAGMSPISWCTAASSWSRLAKVFPLRFLLSLG